MKLQFKQFKGSLFIVLASLMYGSYGVFSKYLADYGIFYQVGIRALLIALFLLLIGYLQKSFKKIERKDIKWFLIINFFTIFSIAPITFAFGHLSLGTSSFLFYSAYLIFNYLLGIIFFQEKITVVKIISFVASVLGLLTIFTVQFSLELLPAMLMAILTGIGVSGEIVFTKKVSDRYSNIQINGIIYLVIAISHIVMSVVTQEDQSLSIITQTAPILIGFSIISLISSWALVEGYKYLEPSIASIIGLTEIIFSVLFGIIVFSEMLTGSMILGGALILFAATLPNIVELSRSKYNE